MYPSNRLSRLVSKSTVMTCTLGKATCMGMDKINDQLNSSDINMRKTQIICTIGPSSSSVDILLKLIDNGMGIARLNFSHGDHESHLKTLNNIREAISLRPNHILGILLDTKGPEIRTGKLLDGKPITVKSGTKLKITTDYSYIGNNECISCSYPLLPTSVSVGSTILIADGTVTCNVIETSSNYIIVEMINDSLIGENKNMNLPGCKVELPIIGDKDRNDIVNFALKHKLDFIALSFVQHSTDIQLCRQIIIDYCANENIPNLPIKIIAKIENLEGVNNFDSICNEADGIMVARGDLGMEIPPEKIFVAQKCMIAKCNIAGKPVVTATQMLESMIKNSRPTRAEVTDVANAVLDGSDCVMLSGETANGLFPVEAVNVMARVCVQAEACINYPMLYHAIHSSVPKPISIPEALACAAVESASDINAKLILVITENGNTPLLVAKYRPERLILACTAKSETARCLKIARGVRTYVLPNISNKESVIKNTLLTAKENGFIESGDFAVAIFSPTESFSNICNIMKIFSCP